MQSKLLNESYAERERVKLPMIRAKLVSLAARPVSTAPCTNEANIIPFNFCEKNFCSKMCVDRVGVYAETNPNFKSWFYDIVLDRFGRRGALQAA